MLLRLYKGSHKLDVLWKKTCFHLTGTKIEKRNASVEGEEHWKLLQKFEEEQKDSKSGTGVPLEHFRNEK